MGRQIGLLYCMATEQNFEDMMEMSMGEVDWNKQKPCLYLAFAGMLAYDAAHKQQSAIAPDEIMLKASYQEIALLVKTIIDCRMAWYKVPKAEAENEPEPTEEEKEEASKNL